MKKFTEPLPRSLRSLRPNFGFHLVFTSFHLEFLLFWVLRSFDLFNLGDLRMGSGNFFKSYIFENSALSWEKWAIVRLCSQNFHLICPQRRDVKFKNVFSRRYFQKILPLCMVSIQKQVYNQERVIIARVRYLHSKRRCMINLHTIALSCACDDHK